MAESAVSSSINLLGKILLEEGKYLWGAEEKVKELQEELLWMRSFLRKADSVQHKDEIVWMWVCQVQKYVYEAEDVIDKFVIKVVSLRRQNGWRNKMIRYSCIFKELYNLHLAASSIDSLKVKISTLSPKLEKYGLMRTIGLDTYHIEELQTDQLEQIQRNVHVENKKIIGLETNAKEIIEALTSKKVSKIFHSIYGMGGLGKTTLANKVLHDDEVKQHFPGGQAFSYVSKKFKVENVLRDLLQQLDTKKETAFNNLSRNELDSKLRELLKKKCLVVLDDVWTKQGWDSLKTSFTSWEGDTGSKLLLTTRKEEVAKYVDDEALQKPDPLNNEESLQLLQETMRWDPRESFTHEQDHSDIVASNIEKKELVNKMLKVCKGLPLAIVVLGGILRKKQSVSEWKSVLENLSSHLLTGYDHGRSCMEIVLQSYDDLPYHLKQCFLHLAIFPEDYEILTEELYSMWVGEGIVTRSAFCGGRSMSMEDVANVYLRDLAEAGLVQVGKTSEGWIESIRMHDLVRDFCLEKASADNLVKTLDRHQINTSSFDYNDKILVRMAITFSADPCEYRLMKDSIVSNANYLKCIRSLILAVDPRKGETAGAEGDTEGAGELMRCISSLFQVLRVLVFKGLVGRRLSSRIGKLVHLRYLSLRDTSIRDLPSSIGELRFLEILDLTTEWEGDLAVPNILWKLFRLRILLLPFSYEVKGGGELRVDTLIYLETIENLRIHSLRTKDLLNIKNLRKATFGDEVHKESAEDILAFLETSSHLRSCKLKFDGAVIGENTEFLSSLTDCKFELEILGKIVLQEKFNLSLPTYLRCLRLYGCGLKDDPMGMLGSLSHLEFLWLGEGCYAGTEISCKSASFPLLNTLVIWGLKKLKAWEAKNGSMPKLELLVIQSCEELTMIPDVLPSSLETFTVTYIFDCCMPLNIECGAQIVSPYESGAEWLRDAVLSNQDKPVFVILGKAGAGKTTCALKLFVNKKVNRGFDVVAKTWVPKRSSTTSRSSSSSSSCLLPRSNLEQLLRDLSDIHRDKRELSRMRREEVTAEIRQVMQRRKCLVILLNLEFEVDGNLDDELEETFGHRRDSYAERGSKLLITSPSDDYAASLKLIPADYHRFILGTPTPLGTWQMLSNWYNDFCRTNAGPKWNLMRQQSGHPLSTAMFMGLLKTKENLKEWASEHKELLNDEKPMEFRQVFEMCYDDLQLHLRRCLISLASFPDGVYVSTKKLYQMWIAAEFVGAQQDDESEVQNTEESLQKLASIYLNELVDRGMVTVVKQNGRYGKVKACQLKYGLRDMCLAKANEDHPLHTQILAAQLDQNSGTHECNSSPASLIVFPGISVPLYNENEDDWEWMLYICKHFELIRVIDAEGMWNSKGRLPEEVGEYLTHLRYLSLRATWVTQLPSSLENLTNLRTLDLRVKETIVIPDVLWKLKCLLHLYLPQDFMPQHTSKLRLSGLSCMQTLVNMDTDKVILEHLSELKMLTTLSVRKIPEELPDKLAQLSTFLELHIDSQIINYDPTILATKFQYLKKLKIKGTISTELKPEIFPPQLEELTLKYTRLEEDPLAILEKLPKLKHLFLNNESFLGKEMKFSKGFYERADLMLCSLCNLETLYIPRLIWGHRSDQVITIDCPRFTLEFEEKASSSSSEQPSRTWSYLPACLKKGFQ